MSRTSCFLAAALRAAGTKTITSAKKLMQRKVAANDGKCAELEQARCQASQGERWPLSGHREGGQGRSDLGPGAFCDVAWPVLAEPEERERRRVGPGRV
jgi:hypothetical protein